MLSVALHLEIATPRCVADDFAGEIVALNLDTGFYFSLRGLAAAVWRDLAAHNSVGEIVSDIGARSRPRG